MNNLFSKKKKNVFEIHKFLRNLIHPLTEKQISVSKIEQEVI
jgi:hypothetical protein